MVVNLTPHAIVLRNNEGLELTVLPSGMVARVTSTPGALEHVEGLHVPVAAAQTFGAIEGLPPPREGVFLVVSAVVLGALRGTRPDVLGPGTGPNDGAIRNDKGQVVAVTRLVRG